METVPRAACANLMTRALRAHGGGAGVRRLVLSTTHPYLDNFLASPALSGGGGGLEELEFFYHRWHPTPPPPFPPPARRLAPTLRVAWINSGTEHKHDDGDALREDRSPQHTVSFSGCGYKPHDMLSLPDKFVHLVS
ncbi:unnamed protein product [Urochloa humidicola]